jgi:hypothetical protein
LDCWLTGYGCLLMKGGTMAYRELHMIELRQVLCPFTPGEGIRPIARGTELDRKTVGRYVRAGTALGLQRVGQRPRRGEAG